MKFQARFLWRVPLRTFWNRKLRWRGAGFQPVQSTESLGRKPALHCGAFQQSENLPVTGELDAPTKAQLILSAPPYTELTVTTNDLARLQPLGTNWFSKAQQTRMDYETILELVSEKVCCHPNFLKQLNPLVNWTNGISPTSLRVPNIEKTKPQIAAAFVRIRFAEKFLEAFDADTNLVAHFPCSIAQRIEKRPVGELRVATIAENPDYTFQPGNFS